MTLTDFVLARISEDEGDAQDDIRNRYGVKSAPHRLDCELNTYDSGPCDCGYPARVLVECEAKRRIVADHEMTVIGPTYPDGYWLDAYCVRCTADGEYADITQTPAEQPCATLRALATIYSDHPDYRDEWRP